MVARTTIATLFIYGVVLCGFALWATGGGHGTYTLLGLAGAPFSLFGIPFAILASLLQWGVLGFAARRTALARGLIVALMAAHYIVAAYLLLFSSGDFSDWEYVQKFQPPALAILVLGIAWYFAGQVFVWRSLLCPSRGTQRV